MGSLNHLSKFISHAATLTDKLRPLLREKNEKKKMKKIEVPVKKFKWGPEYTVIVEDLEKTAANIAKLNYYDPAKKNTSEM